MQRIKIPNQSSAGSRVKRSAGSKGRVKKAVGSVQPIHLRRILVPVDFSEESRKAVAYAIPFAQQFSAAIYLLHVMTPISYVPYNDFPFPMALREEPAEVKSKLRDFWIEFKEAASIKAVMLCAEGRAFHEICECSKLLGVDLVIMPTHGYTGMEHLFLGGTTERVVRHASCPVLVVRKVEHDFI